MSVISYSITLGVLFVSWFYTLMTVVVLLYLFCWKEQISIKNLSKFNSVDFNLVLFSLISGLRVTLKWTCDTSWKGFMKKHSQSNKKISILYHKLIGFVINSYVDVWFKWHIFYDVALCRCIDFFLV